MAPSYKQNTAKIGEIRGTVNLGFKRPVHKGYTYTVQRVPESWGLPTMGGFSLKMGAFSERGTLSRSSKRLSSCTALKKSCSIKWLTTSLPVVVNTRSLGSLLKAPKGSAATTSSASPIRGGVLPQKEKESPPAPKQCWEW